MHMPSMHTPCHPPPLVGSPGRRPRPVLPLVCTPSAAQRRQQPVKALALPGLRGRQRHAGAAQAVHSRAAAA